ncbi:signal peptidase II [Sneathia vaginalis]|uniref:signal peptidase II n=1 Tax=Sneathia vaginalis TaxID=187101 RepID=UPI0025964A1B|nr:signal peptidase II [Sneathia vaginalis]
MKKNNEEIVYALIVVLLLGIDQLTKQAIRSLANGVIGYSFRIMGDFLRFTYVENHGGIFGIFQGHIRAFTIVSSILIIYIYVTELKNFSKYSNLTKIGVLFIVAGALGNMFDRFFRGYVIDMIDFRTIWSFIFNVADMYIHIGVYLIVIAYILKRRKKK